MKVETMSNDVAKTFASIDADYKAAVDAADAVYKLATTGMSRKYRDGDAHRAAFADASAAKVAAYASAMDAFNEAWNGLSR